MKGMGEKIYDEVVGKEKIGRKERIYEKVGKNEKMIEYIVRRIIEKGEK